MLSAVSSLLLHPSVIADSRRTLVLTTVHYHPTAARTHRRPGSSRVVAGDVLLETVEVCVSGTTHATRIRLFPLVTDHVGLKVFGGEPLRAEPAFHQFVSVRTTVGDFDVIAKGSSAVIRLAAQRAAVVFRSRVRKLMVFQ
jgi:hypothetical protein